MAQFNDTVIRGTLGLVKSGSSIVVGSLKQNAMKYTGTAISYGDSNIDTIIDGNITTIKSTLVFSKNYGTEDPEDAVTSPKTGQIYFKIIS